METFSSPPKLQVSTTFQATNFNAKFIDMMSGFCSTKNMIRRTKERVRHPVPPPDSLDIL